MGGTGVLVGPGVAVGGVVGVVAPVAVADVELATDVAVAFVGMVPLACDTNDQSAVGELADVVDGVAGNPFCPVSGATGRNQRIPAIIPNTITMEMLPIIILRLIRVPSTSATSCMIHVAAQSSDRSRQKSLYCL